MREMTLLPDGVYMWWLELDEAGRLCGWALGDEDEAPELCYGVRIVKGYQRVERGWTLFTDHFDSAEAAAVADVTEAPMWPRPLRDATGRTVAEVTPPSPPAFTISALLCDVRGDRRRASEQREEER